MRPVVNGHHKTYFSGHLPTGNTILRQLSQHGETMNTVNNLERYIIKRGELLTNWSDEQKKIMKATSSLTTANLPPPSRYGSWSSAGSSHQRCECGPGSSNSAIGP
jgi:hypothetical protein